MGKGSEAHTVELVSGVDITALPLAPLEGFVLSRIDGRTAVRDVSLSSGLPAEQVEQVIERLHRLGALRIWDAEGRPMAAAQDVSASANGTRPSADSADRGPVPDTGSGRARRTASDASSAKSGTQPAVQLGGSRHDPHDPVVTASTDPPPPYDPKELEEEVDLPMERRKQVLDLYYRLEDMTYYDALNVHFEATRKEIRTAYFGLSKAFHPDTMFRRELGSYKSKMETVFKRLTEAYECLSKKRSRADYDTYLKATNAILRTERELRRSKEVLEATAPDPAPSPEDVVQPEPEAAPEPAPVPTASPQTARGRRVAREVMARRFTGSRLPAVAKRPPPPPPEAGDVDPTVSRRNTLRGLASTLRQAAGVTGDSLDLEGHLARARTSEANGDLLNAQKHLRRAASIAPSRQDIVEDHWRLSSLVTEKLAGEYIEQAELEEKQGKWSSAALTWVKVLQGRDRDAHAAVRAAAALLKAGSDLRRAHELAQQAVMWEPGQLTHRVVLAQVMLNIGLVKGARRELKAASKLDPDNEIVKNLMADLDRHGG